METKRKYERLSITPISFEMRQCYLDGSNTATDIEVQQVSVFAFEDDTTFQGDGFKVEFD